MMTSVMSMLFDGFLVPLPLAVLGVEFNSWIAGTIAVLTIIGTPGMLWTLRQVRERHRRKHCRWAAAAGLVTSYSVEVRPAGLLRRLRRSRKFARTTYSYAYEVNGVTYEGAGSVVEDIDIAYDPRFHARKIAAEKELPIKILEASPKVSMLNLPAKRSGIPARARKQPVNQWALSAGCACAVLCLLSAWRFSSWLQKQHAVLPSPTEAALAAGPDGISAKKIHHALSTDKKSTISSGDSSARNPKAGSPLADR